MTDAHRPSTPPALSADPARLELRIRQVLAAGRPAAARPMLRVLDGLGAAPAVLAELRARLAMTGGAVAEAEAALTEAICAHPGVAGLHACRAEARVRLDRPAAALPDAAEAVLLAPGAADAKALLGLVLIEAGQPADAVRCLTDAVESDPTVASYRLAYAEALHRMARPEDALFVLGDGIRLLPDDLALRRAAMFHAVRARQFTEAVAVGTAARADWVVDASVLGLLGHALGALGRAAEAADAYAEAARLDPADPYVRHLAAAGGRIAPGPCAPPDYVRVVFDGYAERFDGHLLSLGYRVPGLIRAALEDLPDIAGPVTDLGCGTGLTAVACEDLAGPWTGVDLSPAMLDQARRRGLYDRLVEGEIGASLPGLPSAGLVLAGDVLCYFGALDGILATIRSHLRSDGHAVVSVEEATGAAPVAIGPQGRFSHSECHVREAAGAAGLRVVALRRDVLRREAGSPVAGLIVTLDIPDPPS